ncbi:MAG: hypothetical protein ACXAEU_08785 [Candidatus Hodarchaeales archaeon]|jgi:hypothetical protein
MITQVDPRIISSLAFLGGASIIELVSSILIIRKDKSAWTNRIFALAFLSLSIALLVNTFYVLLEDPDLVTWLNTLSIFFAIFGAFLFFSGSLIIFYGPSRNLAMRIVIILGSVVIISIVAAFLTQRWTVIDPEAGVSQFIYWDLFFTLYSTLPIFLAVVPSLYIFIKLFRDLSDEDSSYRRPFLLLIVGMTGLLLSYPVLVLPHFLVFIVPNLPLMIFLGLIAGVGVIFSSILIFLGFFLRPS